MSSLFQTSQVIPSLLETHVVFHVFGGAHYVASKIYAIEISQIVFALISSVIAFNFLDAPSSFRSAGLNSKQDP